MEGFQRRFAELQALGARVVGVSMDSWAVQGAFSRELGLAFPLLSDWPNNRTIATFGVEAEAGPTARRVTFVFDAAGVVRSIVDDAKEMEAHPDGALAAVQSLVDGGS
ncbi:MAG: Peroxiredoxin [Chloroflexi bacterium]|nr:MAG: Peroxiredoxin [Chloroflexota bacterium]